MISDFAGYRIAGFEEAYRADVIALWHACGLTRPWNDPDKDIDRKLSDKNGGFFVLLLRDPDAPATEEKLVGSVMAGYDGHRGSIYYLSIAPDLQAEGLGKFMMAHCEEFLTGLGCPKIHLMVRRENEQVIAFYEKLGYSLETSPTFGKRLIPDI